MAKAIFPILLVFSLYSGYSQTGMSICGNIDPQDAERKEKLIALESAKKATADRLRNTQAPEFAYEDINGDIVKSADFKNKYI